jgi:hypothetical protein
VKLLERKEKLIMVKYNLVGQKFNKLTVISKSNKTDKNRNTYWHCQCDCGGPPTEVTTDSLINNRIKSCGCSRRKEIDLTGQRFDRWSVISFSHYDNKNYYWLCECSCEKKTTRPVERSRLMNGKSKSCGCINREITSERRRIDITGQKFNMLTAIRRANPEIIGTLSIWHCQCDCGGKRGVIQGDLTSNKVKSCGCLKETPDITGKTFGLLTVLHKSEEKHPRATLWTCKCECGNVKDIKYGTLTDGTTISCGCYKSQLFDELTIGKKFGYLTVISRGKTTETGGAHFWCKCDCGSESKEILGVSLRKGHTFSCGCYQKERASETHFKGTTAITEYCRSKLKNWKEKSKYISEYTCVITKERFHAIHHVYPFSKIVEEIVEFANLPIYESMGDYTKEDISVIDYWCSELHKKYGLGVCLNKKNHEEFHSLYGNDFTFEEFKTFYFVQTGEQIQFDLAYT